MLKFHKMEIREYSDIREEKENRKRRAIYCQIRMPVVK